VRRCYGGLEAIAGPDGLILHTPIETHGEDLKTVAEFTVGKGDRVPFVLSWYPSHEPPPREVDPENALRDTENFWRDWSNHLDYRGPWRDAVMRSLITLKGLTYAPTGGIVAALTTSLPEEIGGVRNWDYRFCWVRDATFTLVSLLGAGFYEEARGLARMATPRDCRQSFATANHVWRTGRETPDRTRVAVVERLRGFAAGAPGQ